MRTNSTLLPVALAVALASGTAMAQDHSQHHATPQPEATHDHAAMGHATPPEPEPAQAHDHAAMDHSQHDMPAPAQTPREPIPVLTDADRRAAFPDLPGHAVHDRTVVGMVQFNRLETWEADDGTGLGWEGQAWVGNDEHRLWLRSEGEREDGHLEGANVEAFYGRPVAPWWDLLAGVRQDFRHGDSQTFAGIGMVGLSPYKFEVSATAYIGESGQTAASLEVEYETLFTNRLILQSLVEAELYGRDDPHWGIGSGLGTVELGMRLRYEFTRRFAPYIGIAHERAFGRTADLRREEGEGIEDTRVVAGVRIWF